MMHCELKHDSEQEKLCFNYDFV